MSDSLEYRVQKTEDEIEEIDKELKEIRTEMRKQEDRMEKKIEEKFREFELKLDKNNESQEQKSERILQALDVLKEGQHKQDIKNIETDNLLKQLAEDRQERKEEAKHTKWWLLGILATVIGSILLRFLPLSIGLVHHLDFILKEVTNVL